MLDGFHSAKYLPQSNPSIAVGTKPILEVPRYLPRGPRSFQPLALGRLFAPRQFLLNGLYEITCLLSQLSHRVPPPVPLRAFSHYRTNYSLLLAQHCRFAALNRITSADALQIDGVPGQSLDGDFYVRAVRFDADKFSDTVLDCRFQSVILAISDAEGRKHVIQVRFRGVVSNVLSLFARSRVLYSHLREVDGSEEFSNGLLAFIEVSGAIQVDCLGRMPVGLVVILRSRYSVERHGCSTFGIVNSVAVNLAKFLAVIMEDIVEVGYQQPVDGHQAYDLLKSVHEDHERNTHGEAHVAADVIYDEVSYVVHGARPIE